MSPRNLNILTVAAVLMLALAFASMINFYLKYK